jgi:hypothetical protein
MKIALIILGAAVVMLLVYCVIFAASEFMGNDTEQDYRNAP